MASVQSSKAPEEIAGTRSVAAAAPASQNGKQHVTEGRTIVQTRPPRHAPLRAAVEALAVWGPSELYLPR